MALNRQVNIYSVDTSDFYYDDEMNIHNLLNKMFLFRSNINKKIQKCTSEEDKANKEKYSMYFQIINRGIKQYKKILKHKLKHNSDKYEIRSLRDEAICSKNIISVFESTLTRTIGLSQNEISTDLIVVQTYYFSVLEDIILKGFMYGDEKYVVFTASAGQIRTKKTVMIKESVLKKYQMSLMCGLTIEKINELGGININKYLAYLALCNSATDKWENFDIDKAIVVDDFETSVRGLVDFIDDKTYEITRKEMDILISHTDGCGMILPQESSKSFMTRLPWLKGLLVPTPFDKFINKKIEEGHMNCGKVKDIYGKEYDILKDNIRVIFTKSQFKSWKYYPNEVDENGNVIKYGWDKYKENFKEYKCEAGKCNEEEDFFSDAKINYQMLQTLVDMTDDELEKVSSQTKHDIENIGKDIRTMLKLLGVIKANTNKNYLQQAIEVYPQLLNDTYSKTILKQVKKSRVIDGKAAKIDVDGKYTFICPDVYAFCEWLFLGEKNPKGLLEDGEVFCDLYKRKSKLDCLRSPHLYREHAIRKNISVHDEERYNNLKEWFVTNGIYTSCHDLISKILQFDVDGDRSLVLADDTIIEVAERNMKDIVPLYYDMAKAGAEKVSNESIYNGLNAAYTGGNIGMISNDITKIWNRKVVDEEAIKAIKILCMENNFVIDYAKTLYKPTRPKEIKKLISKYTKGKTPHFFKYAKDKKTHEVEKRNNSTVNKLEKMIPSTRIDFSAIQLDNFDYTKLMSNKDVEIDDDIVNKYEELDLRKKFMENQTSDEDSSDTIYLYQEIRNKILDLNSDINYVVDVLVKYLYEKKNSSFKTTLWSSFGDVLVENLKKNVDVKYIYCEKCGVLTEMTSNRSKYCATCWKKKEKKIRKKINQKYYNKNKEK